MAKENLFVCGCARSGTTALARLLVGSDEIVIGIERYANLSRRDDFRLTPELFEKERFFEVREGDTFYASYDESNRFDRRARMKYDAAKYVGDKLPGLYKSYEQLFDRFPRAKVIFIYRDPLETASSWMGRLAEKKNWPEKRDYRAAVKEWNRSMFLTREWLNAGYEIIVVDYDTIFRSDRSLKPLFDLLEVTYTDPLDQGIGRIRERAQSLDAGRRSLLTDEQKSYVVAEAKSFLVRDLSKLARRIPVER